MRELLDGLWDEYASMYEALEAHDGAVPRKVRRALDELHVALCEWTLAMERKPSATVHVLRPV
jgi:uncharacterized protein (UPF0147 family)